MNNHDNLDDMPYSNDSFKNTLDKSLHTLEGIIKGIAMDGKIKPSEIDELRSWCFDYIGLSSRSPFNEFIPLIQAAISDLTLTEEEIKGIIWCCKNMTTPNLYYDIVSADIQRLQGLLHGIMADHQIEEEELKQLQSWIAENNHLKGSYPYDEIESVITQVMRDGRIDPEEHDFLIVFFSEFISMPTYSTIDPDELSRLKQSITIPGICAVCPGITFKNRSFCFTGISSRARRSEIVKEIEIQGGTYVDNVTPDLNYLITGNNGNQCWAYSCYGPKVEEAISYRKKGANILIVHENDFWDAMG
ncbi:MAG TPA: BRCT domain-containing protein [Bacillota bacterium]|nr:BRCT domain-containing protein [Bacillota bacterium]